MSHEGLHEPADLLGEETRNLHRALVSLIEELEAIDWYQQRADACTDAALKAVLLHNRNEEVEHGMMTLEWLRRNDATFDKFARELPVQGRRHHRNRGGGGGGGSGGGGGGRRRAGGPSERDGSLGIRSLRGRVMALDLLKRKLAPVLPAAFAAVDAEAARVLKLNLAGRRIVDFRGPARLGAGRGQHRPADDVAGRARDARSTSASGRRSR